MAIHNEIDCRLYYDRWAATALRYCKLFLGDQVEADAATQQAFLEILRRATDLGISNDELPKNLMRAVVTAASSRCARSKMDLNTTDFESCIRMLPCAQRAVFLMRNTFGLKANQVAEITNTTVEVTNRTWSDAMLRMRQLWLKHQRNQGGL